jgi:hypothetical protein
MDCRLFLKQFRKVRRLIARFRIVIYYLSKEQDHKPLYYLWRNAASVTLTPIAYIPMLYSLKFFIIYLYPEKEYIPYDNKKAKKKKIDR